MKWMKKGRDEGRKEGRKENKRDYLTIENDYKLLNHLFHLFESFISPIS